MNDKMGLFSAATRGFPWWVFLVTALSLGAHPSEQTTYSFDFRRTSLREAMVTFATASGIDLVFADDLVEGVTLDYAFRDQTPEDILKALFTHTSLEYKWVDDKRVVLLPHPNQVSFDLSGRVMSVAGPIVGARVELKDSPRTTWTDRQGGFQLVKLPRTPLKLTIFAPDHVPVTMSWEPEADGSEVNVVLIGRPFVSEHLTVTSEEMNRWSEQLLAREARSAESLLQNATVSRDLFQGLQSLPGISAGNGEPGLSIRGSRPSENLVLVDQIKLYQIDHAMGHFSALNPDAIRDVSVFKGAYPAEYGDRVNGVLDISLKGEPGAEREYRIGFDRDLAHVTMIQPLGANLSLLASARSSISDTTIRSVSDRVFRTTFNDDPDFFDDDDYVHADRSFEFDDHMLRFSWRPMLGSDVALTFYSGEDRKNQQYEFRVDDLTLPFRNNDGSWGNKGWSGQWTHHYNSNVATRFVVSRSRYQSQFGHLIWNGDTDEQGEFINDTRSQKHELGQTNVQISQFFEAVGHSFQWGVFLDRESTDYLQRRDGLIDEEINEDTSRRGSYAQYEWHRNKVHGLVGLRFGKNEASDTNYSEPRLSLQYDLTPNLAINGGWGKFHQFILRTPDTFNFFDGFPTWFIAEEYGVQPGVSRQTQIGMRVLGRFWSLDLDLYRRNQEGTLGKLLNPGRNDGFNQYAEVYKGADLLLEGHWQPWSMQLAYSYQHTRVVRNIHLEEPFNAYPTDGDRPHNVNLSLNWDHGRWHLRGSWRYTSGIPHDIPKAGLAFDSTGEPYTFYYFEEARNQSRLPDIQVIDARATYRLPIARVKTLIGLSLHNVADRRNITHRFYFSDFSEEPEVTPYEVTDFGFRATLDFQMRF